MDFKILYTNTTQDDMNMINIIDETTRQIKTLINHDLFFDSRTARNVKSNIKKVMKFWINVEIGQRKEKVLNDSFQSFYSNLLKLIIKKRKFKYLYQGTVYRYLGNFPYSNNLLDKVEYNDTYVSWSKNENVIKCIECKLCEPYIKLTAVIRNDNYGLDLEKFGIYKNNEQEVVFPTIKDTIKKIECLACEEDKDEY